MKIKNNPKVIAAINKIGDLSIRTDNNTRVDILGDNLEFLTILTFEKWNCDMCVNSDLFRK